MSYDSLVEVFSDPDSLSKPVSGIITGVASKISEAQLEVVNETEEEAVDYGDSRNDGSLRSLNSPRQNTDKFDGFSAEALQAIDSLEGDTPAREVGGNTASSFLLPPSLFPYGA